LKLSLYSLTLSQATLAQSLAQRIIARYPPVIANSPERVVSRERVEEILDAVFCSELQRGSRLGLVPRVMLGYALKRRLQETGYDDEFIDFATRTLRRRLSHPDA
jgi:hypothetical protein